MAQMPVITFEVKLAWWVMPYVHTLALLCAVFDRRPDYNKLAGVIARGLRFRVVR